MQIDPKVLHPKNYSNPRYIEVTNPKIKELYEAIKEHQEKVMPYLKRYEEIEAKKAELRKPFDDYVKETKEEIEDMNEAMQAEDQKASKVKEKLIPLVEEEVIPHLTELDEFVGLDYQGEKLVAKVNDRIEEWVKAVREQAQESKKK